MGKLVSPSRLGQSRIVENREQHGLARFREGAEQGSPLLCGGVGGPVSGARILRDVQLWAQLRRDLHGLLHPGAERDPGP